MHRLSDLVDATAYDSDGTVVGQVEDVRLVQDGPFVEGFGHKLRVDGVVIGKRVRGLRLGFGRSDVRGPWLLKAMFARLERHARYYSWDEFAWEPGAIRLKAGATPSTPPA
ncbi:MAG: hypothetical protein QOD30_1763 [Actinomycetota bacterium]|jgi:hypothetical protein|nr:hypothetical protein [Actinomycetota bacterium]